MATIKQQRTAAHIQQVLSEVLAMEIADPRLMGVTVTEVNIDRELRHANVYVGALGDDVRESDVMDGLKSANGFLRRELAQRVRLRNAPFLNFHWDVTLQDANRISSLLDDLDIPDETSNEVDEDESDNE